RLLGGPQVGGFAVMADEAKEGICRLCGVAVPGAEHAGKWIPFGGSRHAPSCLYAGKAAHVTMATYAVASMSTARSVYVRSGARLEDLAEVTDEHCQEDAGERRKVFPADRAGPGL